MSINNTAVQSVLINDFSPGIMKFGRGSYGPTYPLAPPGSASVAFRCYMEPNVGLCPFPSYDSGSVVNQLVNSANGSFLMRCDMRSFGISTNMNTEFLAYSLQYYDGTTSRFALNTINVQGGVFSGNVSVYNSSQAGVQPIQTPNLVLYYDRNLGVSVVTMDPLNTSATIQKMEQWSGALLESTTLTVPQQFFDLTKLFVQSSRIVGMAIETFLSGNSFTDYFISDPPQQVFGTPIQFARSKMEPSQIMSVGSWGSIDAGEAFLIGQAGGAMYVTGDILAPTSIIKLPGVVSTGPIVGPSAQCTDGYIYLSDSGAYLWNGGNSSQKVSAQIPDDVLWRTAGFTFNPFPVQRPILTHHDTWGDWVMFANNWMYSTLTHSWWQVEDPTIQSFAIHTPSLLSNRYFFSSEDYKANTSGGPLTIQLKVFCWDLYKPSSSYVWVSNPIATQPGYLNTLQSVEVVASNPSSTPATITLTPRAPDGQMPFPNNNPQSVTFTIPPTTSCSRQSAELGWTDWNIQIGVNAANTVPPNQAPIIHQLFIEYNNALTSGVGL